MSKESNSKGYHPPQIIDDSYCVDCGLCALLCPDFAIYVEDAGARTPTRIVPIHRER